MPELPEVETNVKALKPHLIGRKVIKSSVFTDKLRSPLSVSDFTPIAGKKIIGIRRRAKYILIDLSGQSSLMIHLGMTGAFRICPVEDNRKKHEHVIFTLNNGQSWRFEDPRKFGLVKLWDKKEGDYPNTLRKLGLEPLESEFNGRYLKKLAAKRNKSPVKNFIMDQQVVVGVGNIYASESLFRARINPRRKAGSISEKRYALLAESIKTVLQEAIVKGGTTISDYKSVDGGEGRFSIDLRVYGKEGTSCPGCVQHKIKRIIIGGRSTFYCPKCQK